MASEGIAVGTSFPLMELPPELRSCIFNEVAKDNEAWLSPDGPSRLICPIGLSSASKQVRDEFSASLYLSAHATNFEVVDLEFGRIIAFLSKLSDNELDHIAKDTQGGARKLWIYIKITDISVFHGERLRRWLKHFDDLDKEGAGIAFYYDGSKQRHIKDVLSSVRHRYSWDSLMDMRSRKLKGTTKREDHFKRLRTAVSVAERRMIYGRSS